jgi:hypothetical protein
VRAESVAALALLALLGCSSCGGGNAGASSLRTATLLSDNRTLELEFDVCNASPAEVTVEEETASEVVLAVSVGGGTDDACADGAMVLLSQPLSDRRVMIEGADGTYEIDVYRPGGGGPPPTTSLSSLLTP